MKVLIVWKLKNIFAFIFTYEDNLYLDFDFNIYIHYISIIIDNSLCFEWLERNLTQYVRWQFRTSSLVSSFKAPSFTLLYTHCFVTTSLLSPQSCLLKFSKFRFYFISLTSLSLSEDGARVFKMRRFLQSSSDHSQHSQWVVTTSLILSN